MKTILSLDGGGIRGIIPCIFLAELEKRLGKPVSEAFDLIAGTSTGGIIALGLTKPDTDGAAEYTAKDMLELYLDHAKTIFPKSLWGTISRGGGYTDEKYPHEPLEKLLDQYFSDTRLDETLSKVLISSYAIEERRPFFFKSWRPDFKTVLSRSAARATSAAPTYFEPAPLELDGVTYYLVDGGVFVNNPAVSAYAEAKKEFPDEEIIVVSVGTGHNTRKIPYEEAKDWGKAGWMLPVMSTVFDGVSDAADYQLQQLLGDRFYRFQVSLQEASDDMDCVTSANLNSLQKEAKRMIRENKNLIDALVHRLE